VTGAPTTSLFLQALGLVAATLAAVVVFAAVVALNIPPPSPDVYSVAEVVRALRTGKPVATVEGQPLTVREAERPPAGSTFGRRHLDFRAGLAHALGLRPDDILVLQNETRIVAFVGPHRHLAAPPAALDQTVLLGRFQVAVRQPDGRWRVVQPRRALLDPWQQRVLFVLTGAAAAVTPLAWWFARRLAAPIKAFAEAAERLGRDPDAPPLSVGGSAEVGVAASAFNEMQRRLKRYVQYRTAMMAAIAHDLRTPLTRLRFRIESAPDELKAKVAHDLDEMEAMISSTLAFVKDANRAGERTKLELSSLVESVMDEAAETGADASVERAERAVIDGDPVSLKRLVVNLVDNALKYGLRARGRVFAEGGVAVLEIDDDGPGLAEAEIERAFEPFHRIENSRSRETGGIGLGLAVAREIARGHGGDVVLQNRPGGGLRARVSVPLAVRSARPAQPAPTRSVAEASS